MIGFVGAIAAALALVAGESPEVRRVLVLPDAELTLDLPDGWDPAATPLEFSTSRTGWDALLAKAMHAEWPESENVAAAVAHVELDVESADDGDRMRVTLHGVGAVASEEVAFDGVPPPFPRLAPDPGRAVAITLSRIDPGHDREASEPVDERPALERAAHSATLTLRCAADPSPITGARRGWVVAPSGERRFRIFPTDLDAEVRCVAPPAAMRPFAAMTLPRYRLSAATESLVWSRSQALDQLASASEAYPDSPDPIARLVIEELRDRGRSVAITSGSNLLVAHPGVDPKSPKSAVLSQLLAWLVERSAESPIRIAPRRFDVEVLGDPRLSIERFTAAAQQAQELLGGAMRHHDLAAETAIVLLGASEDAAAIVERIDCGWLALRQIAMPITEAPEADADVAWRTRLESLGPCDLAVPAPAGSLRLEHLGHACFRLTADDGTRLLIDPFSSRYWLRTRFPWVFADGVAITHDHPDHAAIGEVAGAPTRLALDVSPTAPPEQTAELGPFRVHAFATPHDRRYTGGQPLTNLVLAIDVAGMRIVHLGDVQAPLSEELCAELDPVDVLLAPIDDLGHILDAAQLAEIVDRLAPRLLVPMHYRVPLPGAPRIDDLGTIDHWLESAPRVKRLERDDMLLRHADLPAEIETWVFHLAPWPEGRLEAVR